MLEGTLQGLFAALLARLLLALAYLALHGHLDAALAPRAGMKVSFLPPLLAIAIPVSGALLGALGSAVSIRRYLRV